MKGGSQFCMISWFVRRFEKRAEFEKSGLRLGCSVLGARRRNCSLLAEVSYDEARRERRSVFSPFFARLRSTSAFTSAAETPVGGTGTQKNLSYTRSSRRSLCNCLAGGISRRVAVVFLAAEPLDRGTQRGYSSKPLNIALLNVF